METKVHNFIKAKAKDLEAVRLAVRPHSFYLLRVDIMGAKLERLRLETALAHIIPGAEIVFISKDGQEYRAGTHPSADFSLCEIRRIIASSSCPSRPDFTKWIKDFQIKGAIEDSGGGIYRTIETNSKERWFSTTLRPEIVYEILNEADIDGIFQSPVDALLTPDPVLGVTTIRVSVDDDISEELLNELVLIGYSACLVKEISSSLENNLKCGPSKVQKKRENFKTDL